MLGLKHSLNVASAGAVVMYELLRKYRSLQGEYICKANNCPSGLKHIGEAAFQLSKEKAAQDKRADAVNGNE